jgi:hypothetical protein
MAGSIHDRAARALGWPKSATQSMSLQALRELVRGADPELAKDITKHIHSGSVVRGPVTPSANMDWLGPPPTAEQSVAYEKKRKQHLGGLRADAFKACFPQAAKHAKRGHSAFDRALHTCIDRVSAGSLKKRKR